MRCMICLVAAFVGLVLHIDQSFAESVPMRGAPCRPFLWYDPDWPSEMFTVWDNGFIDFGPGSDSAPSNATPVMVHNASAGDFPVSWLAGLGYTEFIAIKNANGDIVTRVRYTNIYMNTNPNDGVTTLGIETCSGGDCVSSKANLAHWLPHEVGHVVGWMNNATQVHSPISGTIMHAPLSLSETGANDLRTTPDTDDWRMVNALYNPSTTICDKSMAQAESALCLCWDDIVMSGTTDVRWRSPGELVVEVYDNLAGDVIDVFASDNLRDWRKVASIGDPLGGANSVVNVLDATYFKAVATGSTKRAARVLWVGTPARELDGESLRSFRAIKSSATLADLDARMMSGKGSNRATTLAAVSNKTAGPGILVVAPDLGQSWDDWVVMLGYAYGAHSTAPVYTYRYTPATTPGTESAVRDGIKAAIVANSEDIYAVHLIGDANDYEVFADGGSRLNEFWTGEWSGMRDELIQDYGYIAVGQLAKNLLPTYIIPNEGLPNENMAQIYPYYFSDSPYGDIDDDGEPEIVVTRWPVADVQEFATMVVKLWDYGQKKEHNGRFSAVSYIVDSEYRQYTGDGERAATIDSVVCSYFPVGTTVRKFVESAWLAGGGGNMLAANVDTWNDGANDLSLFVSAKSSRYFPGGVFPAIPASNWDVEYSLDAGASIALAVECGAGDFCSTEQIVDGVVERPVAERFLQGTSDGGAIVWVGPTVGSLGTANGILAKRILERLYEEPGRSVAESWLLAQTGVLDEYSGDSYIHETAWSYVFLGDPVSAYRRSDQPCSLIATNFVTIPRPAECGTVDISWETSEHIACDYHVRIVDGPVLAVGRTEPGTAHSVTWYGEEDVLYRVNVMPYCEGTSWRGKNFVAKDCVAPAGPKLKTGIVGVAPNPFNPKVTVSYQLKNDGAVTIGIYDIRGRNIATVLNESKLAGVYQATWDGRAASGGMAAAGVYFVVIRADGVEQTERVVLLK